MIEFFINQYKAVNLLVALIIGVGIFTFIQGRKEEFPNIGIDVIVISTVYTGASADNVEKLVTEKIENEIDSIEGAERITSFSSEGLSTIRFEVDGDVGRANNEIAEEIQGAIDTLEFPAAVKDPLVRTLDFATVRENIVVGFIGNVDLEVLKGVANRFEADAKALSGVSKVETKYYRKLEIWVEIIPERLRQHELELSSVITAIQGQNINVPAGKINLAGKEFFIRTSREYESLADIENTIIRGNDSGNHVFLKDIANVRWAHETLRSYRRSQGSDSIWLDVFKTPQGDAIKVSQAIKDLLLAYETNGWLPEGITTTTIDDAAFYVKRRLNVLSSNATVGLLLVFLCMILFFNLSVTLWTMLGIPFSFCLAIILAYSLGMTLNLMTMFGLIIVVGMIVDDAIIIAENIYVHVEQGKSPYEAAVDGTREMLIPVIAIIATTTLAFLPLVTLPGIFGDVLSLIPQIIIITLLCSLIECLFVLPGHLAHLKNKSVPSGAVALSPQSVPHLSPESSKSLECPESPEAAKGVAESAAAALSQTPPPIPMPLATQTTENTDKQAKSYGHFHRDSQREPHAKQNQNSRQRRWFSTVSDFYEKLLGRIVNRPVLTASVFLVILLSIGVILGRKVPFIFFPGTVGSIFVDIETPTSNNLETTAVVIDEAEARIREATAAGDYIVNIISTVGQDSTYNRVVNFQSYLGFIRIVLEVSREKTDDEISDIIEQAMAGVPGISRHRIRVRRHGPSGGIPIEVYVSGHALKNILPGVETVHAFIKNLPNTRAHTTSYEKGKAEININPKVPVAAQLNIKLGDIANSVRYAFAETSSTTLTSLSAFSSNDDEIDLIVKYQDDDEKVLEDINLTPIYRENGRTIPLKNLSELEFQKSSTRLVKEAGDLFISVSARLKDRENIEYGANVLSKMVIEQIPKWSKQFPSLTFALKGQRERQKELTAGIIKALFLSLFGIYFVLTIIFRSYTQPLLIMSIIPLGFIGVIIGLFLTGAPLGLMAFLGGVALMGIVVNDSLVMIDKINRLRRDEHLDVRTAVIKGAKIRMRPILMTSLTTVVGIAPLAYGWVGQEPFLTPMAISLMWGLIVSTFLLLVLLPAFYLILDKMLNLTDRFFDKSSDAPAPTTSRPHT